MGWGTVARGSSEGRKLIKTSPLGYPDDQEVCSGFTLSYPQLLVIDGGLQEITPTWAIFRGSEGKLARHGKGDEHLGTVRDSAATT